MSGLWRALLPWTCVIFWATCLIHGALVISRNGPTTPKRSISDAQVEVQSVTVDCKVASRFAHTVMTSTALNKASSSQEIFFEVELPKTAFITYFSMEIEGETYVGVVKEKETAINEYEQAVSSDQTAGLVKASGRNMEKFSVSVNIAANSKVIFILNYEELLQRKLGKYEILTRVRPKQPVQNFQIVADIYEPQGMEFVDAYSTFLSEDLLPLVEKTVTENKAHISFSPTLEQQMKCPGCDGTLIDGDFIIQYDVKRENSLGHIQIMNGYFVHFFAPPDLPIVPKNVVFVVDGSGSMYGTKLQQTKQALAAITQDLREEDSFALIVFDDQIQFWRPALSVASKENVAEAIEYINHIGDRGLSDINGAMMEAVDMLKSDRSNDWLPERSVDMIVLLTDGMPNAGVRHIPSIQENVREAVNGSMSVFCLGFGNDVDYSFLDVMAKQNNGVARRIYEASDATLQLQGFYEEVASPLLSEVDLRYPDNTVDFLTTNHFSQLFNGSEIIVAGRLTDNYVDNFMVEVYADGFEDQFQAQGLASAVDWNSMYPDQAYMLGDYTERLWAYLTIQQLLEKSKSCTEDEKTNVLAEALDLSLKYSFVTPLSSLVVIKPETEDGTETLLVADKLTEEQRQQEERRGLRAPLTYTNFMHITGSGPTSFVDGDPHFMIELPDRQDTLCFNINDTPGTIFNLVKDPADGILINGQTIGDKEIPPSGKINTYFGHFGIVHKTLGVVLDVTTEDITVFQDKKELKLLWSDLVSLNGPNVDLLLTTNRSLEVTLRDSIKFVILLHQVWKNHPYHQDYLGFYTLDSHLLSSSVHGLLGQFYHGIEFEVGDLRPGETPQKPDATMYVKGREISVTRGWQRDFRMDVKNGENVPCWFIHYNGTGLIDGHASDYIVSGLFENE